MKQNILFILFLLVTSTCYGQDLLSDKTLLWTGSTWGNGFGHKLYAIDPQIGGRTDLRIAGRSNSTSWSDILTITTSRLIGINTNYPVSPLHISTPIETDCNGILFGENPKPMGTEANSFSPNLFLFQNKLDSYLGLHAYIYRKNASTSWSGGTVRLSSVADGAMYSQNDRYNNLNWIDFNGNGDGIDLGTVNNTPAISIRGMQVGIGTTTPDQALTVKGKIHTNEVIIDMKDPIADYVFDDNYKLMPLHQVEQFVKANNHLPEIPSAAEVSKNGMSMGEMQNKLLQKVEELTLYVIDLKKTIDTQQAEIKELKQK